MFNPKCVVWFVVFVVFSIECCIGQESAPFGPRFPTLDSMATGQWWTAESPPLMLPRVKVIGFSLYTVQNKVLKLTAQMYPLLPDESRDVTLEFDFGNGWERPVVEKIVTPGWSAHFRIEKWDEQKGVPFRLTHAGGAEWTGSIRPDPSTKNEIVVATLSCNSSGTPGDRNSIVRNILKQNPDLLFFAGDQTYEHTQHTHGWLEFGAQFGELMRDRPTVTIPDDHDVGHPNLWGENGKVSLKKTGSDGGFFYPANYVNMVQRCQTWHLPDPVDPEPVEQGITVYFTRLNVGGIDFAILEDRKFKTGPENRIPKMGPRPDHINDPSYDPKTIDLPGLELLGERQTKFLGDWGQDWTGSTMKCVLSQTAFYGAVHMHGKANERLLADLDCNGWPQTGRNLAIAELRRCRAVHLCGDQHLAVVVKHGIDVAGDGSYGFTSPAIVNTIYGRWWHPESELPGDNAVPHSPLPWTGDFLDGLGNPFRMLAYSNPANVQDEKQRADGYGLVRFNRSTGDIRFECWPRFSNVDEGDGAQFPGWPISVNVMDNEGRVPTGWLPELTIAGSEKPVVQVC